MASTARQSVPADGEPQGAGAAFVERALAALHALAQASGDLTDPTALAELACVHTRNLLGVRHATLLLWNEDAGALLALASTWKDAAALARLRLAAGEGVSGAAFAGKAPVVASDYRGAPAHLTGAIVANVASAASVPLRAGSRVIGVLSVWSTDVHAFQQDELHFLDLIATQVGPAIELARLAAERERRRQEAETRAALLAASEARLRAVFDSMACGVNVRAADGRLLYANEASRAILGDGQAEDGYSEHPGRWDVLGEDGAPLSPEQFPHSVALRTGRAVRDAVIGVRDAAGGRRTGGRCRTRSPRAARTAAAARPPRPRSGVPLRAAPGRSRRPPHRRNAAAPPRRRARRRGSRARRAPTRPDSRLPPRFRRVARRYPPSPRRVGRCRSYPGTTRRRLCRPWHCRRA